MERNIDTFESGLSFDSSDLLFQNNSQFFSELEEFPGYGPVEPNKNDFHNQSLTMQDLQMPFQAETWDSNYSNDFPNFSGVEFSTENVPNYQNHPDFKCDNIQSCPDPSYIPAPPYPPSVHYQTEQMQYLGVPQDYPKPAESYSHSPNSDYYSGNLSSDSSPHSSTPTSNPSPPAKPTHSKKGAQPKHNVGNLPDGLMKALTTVLCKTNNPAFKQLMQSSDSQSANKKSGKSKKLASRPNPDSSKRAPVSRIPIVKPVALSNKPSLEEMRKKKAERMIRNREAALQSRKRKLDEQAALEDTCRELQDRNIQLEKRVSFLEGESTLCLYL